MGTGLSRRELLTLMLGAPILASLGCQSSTLPPEGDLLAPDFSRGHKLRDPELVKQPPASVQDVDVVIVGAGVAGLSAAWQLKRAGIDNLVVLELEPHGGGTAHSGESDVSRYPWGAHYVPVPTLDNPLLISLFEDMDLLESRDADGRPIVKEQYLCRDPQERVFHDGKWFEGLFPHTGAQGDDIEQFKAFYAEMHRLAGLRDEGGRRFFTIPVANCGINDEFRSLDDISMARWLERKGWTSPRLRWYVDYACRDDYGMLADQTSAWAGVFYFVSRIEVPNQKAQPFVTWPEGNGRIVRHLTGTAGDCLRTGRLVTSIENTSPGVTVDAFTSDAHERYTARRAVFAGPQFVAPHVIKGLSEQQSWRGRGFQYGSWMVANLHLSDRPAENNGFPLCWDNVAFGSRSLGYIVATHQSGKDHGPTVLTYYYPYCDEDVAERRELLLNMDWAEWSDVILTDLHQVHSDIRQLVTRIDIMRWGHAMIRPRPGFVFNPSRVNAKQPFGNVHFANTDLSAVALMEEAFYHGTRAADEVLEAIKA